MERENQQLIISISREYGAGGHEIAVMLAERFNLPLIDEDSIAQHFADEFNFDFDEVKQYSGKPFNRLLHRQIKGYTNTLEDNLSQMQFDYLREKAAAGESFVVVGRCSETVLKDYELMTAFFVLADEPDKVRRVMEREGLSEEEAAYTARRGTRDRKSYHNYYCSEKWGDSRLYDMCINTSKIGLEKATDVMELYVHRRMAGM